MNLDVAARELENFGAGSELTAKIASLEHEMAGRSRKVAIDALRLEGIAGPSYILRLR